MADSVYGTVDKTRIQATGAGLEMFIRDSFCGIPGTIINRQKEYDEVFSWLGSKNNPPDAMLRSSDAIEMKKHEGSGGSELALNSSPPRSKLTYDDSKILTDCRNAEVAPWTKDYLYALGNIETGNIKEIIFCYGDCFVANKKVYQTPVDVISAAIGKLKKEGMELKETNELGKVGKIDPLGYSGLRVRGMWGLKSPSKIFADKIARKGDEKLLIAAIMRKQKFESFPEECRKDLLKNSFEETHFQSPDPDDPESMIDLVLVKYTR